jgi:hypothetical protein
MPLIEMAHALLAIRLSKEDLNDYEGGLPGRPRPYPRPYIDVVRVLLSLMRAQSIVEVGSIRSPMRHPVEEFNPACCFDGHSTLYWATTGCEVHTVDIDPNASRITAKACSSYSNVHVYNADAIDFLRAFSGKIDFLYLDAWDIGEGEPYAEKHLEAYEAARPKLKEVALISVDDTDIMLGGKGRLAVPAMVRDGFELLATGRQTMLVRVGG